VVNVLTSVGSLEEQVLRVLYDGSASARECATGLAPYAQPSAEWILEIEDLLWELAGRSYLHVEAGPEAPRYSLTRAGSERLADLVE
jgi:hypothetical protein